MTPPQGGRGVALGGEEHREGRGRAGEGWASVGREAERGVGREEGEPCASPSPGLEPSAADPVGGAGRGQRERRGEQGEKASASRRARTSGEPTRCTAGVVAVRSSSTAAAGQSRRPAESIQGSQGRPEGVCVAESPLARRRVRLPGSGAMARPSRHRVARYHQGARARTSGAGGHHGGESGVSSTNPPNTAPSRRVRPPSDKGAGAWAQAPGL